MRKASIGGAVVQCALALVLCWSCTPEQTRPGLAAARVVVSVPPLAELVRFVGGSHVEVGVVLPVGASPETWALTPAVMLSVTTADLLVLVGHPEISFETRLAALVERDDVPIAYLDSAVERGRAAAGDPHLWLDLEVLRVASLAVAEQLTRLDPARRTAYEAGAQRYRVRLDEMEARLQALFAGRRLNRVIVQHPAWSRLLDSFGVEEVSVESDGKQATPARLVELIDLARGLEVSMIVAQRGAASRGARLIARECGARVESLDPLGQDLLASLEASAQTIATALR